MSKNQLELNTLKGILEDNIEKTTADLEKAIKLLETKEMPISFELNILCAYLLKLKEVKINEKQKRN